MKLKQVYQEYQIPKNLQEHMLRVAALAEIILDDWTGEEIDKGAVILACALHDLAKPMNFDLNKQAEFGMSPEEITNLARLQDRLKSEYGEDEHQAMVRLAQNLGCSAKVVKLLDELEWSYIPQLLEEGEMGSLIANYCDMRIGPKGIMLLRDRIEEVGKREGSDKFAEKMRNGKIVEDLIANKTDIDLNSINDKQIHKRFEKLLEMEVG